MCIKQCIWSFFDIISDHDYNYFTEIKITAATRLHFLKVRKSKMHYIIQGNPQGDTAAINYHKKNSNSSRKINPTFTPSIGRNDYLAFQKPVKVLRLLMFINRKKKGMKKMLN